MPIGFIPRMASKVGTAVCGTACTVVCEVAWGTNPHAPTRLCNSTDYKDYMDLINALCLSLTGVDFWRASKS